MLTFVDYYTIGIATVLVFYLFKEKTWYNLLIQLLLIIWLNVSVMSGYGYELNILGYNIFFAQQGFAVLSLIPIWLYNGKQGYHEKWFKYFCYLFYPCHLLIIYIIWNLLI